MGRKGRGRSIGGKGIKEAGFSLWKGSFKQINRALGQGSSQGW